MSDTNVYPDKSFTVDLRIFDMWAGEKVGSFEGGRYDVSGTYGNRHISFEIEDLSNDVAGPGAANILSKLRFYLEQEVA